MRFSLLEKIGAAVLICAWVIYGSHFMGEALVHVDESTAAVATHGEASEAKEETAEPAAEEVDFAALLASADAADGEKVFGKCKSCHTVEAGGENKVGPNLHNIVGADIASKDGFAYSGVLAELEGEWGYDQLDAFLADPKGYASGTKMSFAGLKKPEQRAAVIAYLRENSENAPPLPEPQEAAAPAEAEVTAEPTEASEETQEAKAATEEKSAEPTTAAEPAAADGGGDGLAALLASGDAANGEKVFRKCKSCHTVEQGGKHRVGPNLWNVVGSAKAAAEGFNYSDALAGLGGEWSYEDLDAYLASPKEFAPGNKMTFAGVKKPKDRADVILYLREHSDSAQPLP